MRQLAGYAPHLAGLTTRLLRPARNRAIPPVTRQALQDARKWLTITASAHADEQGQAGLDFNTLLLHSIPANLPPPRHPLADGHLSAAELCAGATATAARLRHLAVRAAGQPPWPSSSAAACWRHNALDAAIIGHNSELLLRTLAERGHQLALNAPHLETLRHAADAVHRAWQSCRAVTHAWDPLTTGTSRRPSLIAAELDDLVLWIGRLARTGTWTPAHANAGQPRTPADLTRTPDDITIVLVAVGRIALAPCLIGVSLSAAACSSGPASCAAQITQWENSGASSELRQISTLISTPFPGAEDGSLDLKPATVSAWSSYLGAHPIPSCAPAKTARAYGLVQAEVSFLKVNVAQYDKELLGPVGAADTSNQVFADGSAVQSAIAKLQADLPAST